MRRVDSTIPARMESRDPEIFDLIIFNFLICNGDAHLKNFSVLETESGDFRLSPAYDLINTKLHVATGYSLSTKGCWRQCRRIYALWNDQRHNFPRIRQKIRTAGQNCTTGTWQILCSYPLLDTLIANSYLSDELKENYRNMYLGRRDSYLKIGL